MKIKYEWCGGSNIVDKYLVDKPRNYKISLPTLTFCPQTSAGLLGKLIKAKLCNFFFFLLQWLNTQGRYEQLRQYWPIGSILETLQTMFSRADKLQTLAVEKTKFDLAQTKLKEKALMALRNSRQFITESITSGRQNVKNWWDSLQRFNPRTSVFVLASRKDFNDLSKPILIVKLVQSTAPQGSWQNVQIGYKNLTTGSAYQAAH